MNNTIKTVVCLTLITCVFAVFGAPVLTGINGIVSHGATISVKGSGFGPKAQPAPLLWDPVDGQAAYESLKDGDVVPVGKGCPWLKMETLYANPIKYSTTRTPRGKSRAHYYAFNEGRFCNGPDTQTDQIYISWYVKFSHDIAPGNGKGIKLLRIWDSSADNTRSTVSSNGSYVSNRVNPAGSSVTHWRNWGGKTGEWTRMELLIDSKNHRYRTWANTVANQDFSDWFVDGYALNWLGLIGCDTQTEHLPHPELECELDEFYVDGTCARVEIGNNPVWTACTQKELQVPKAWSGDSIAIEVNQGAFADAAGAYLFVVDAAGNANPVGLPVKFGAMQPGIRLAGIRKGGMRTAGRTIVVDALGRMVPASYATGTSAVWTGTNILFQIEGAEVRRIVR